MNDTIVRDTFDRVLADEPPLTLALDPVVAAGRRVRLRRRIAFGGILGVAAFSAAGVVASVARTGGTTAVQAAPPMAPPRSAVTHLRVTQELTARQRAIVHAIESASPDGWTFELTADRWDDLGVEATADDGSGPGRLMVGISTGTQILHPCRDDDFRRGATCTERTLADGSVLSLRGLVSASYGRRYVDVALTHPDGSGVNAESANFTFTWPLPSTISSDAKDDLLHVSRANPTYTVEQLVDLVVAVDRAVRTA